jgi:L,D-transpeptidase YcbB
MLLKSHHKLPSLSNILLVVLCTFFFSCNEHRVSIRQKEVVSKPEEINVKAEDVLQVTLKDLLKNDKGVIDSVRIKNVPVLQFLYDKNSFQPLWTSDGKFLPHTDSLLTLIDSCRSYGLFPSDYYEKKLVQLHQQLLTDTAKNIKLDASRWAFTDLLLSSAFVQVVKDLKKGRILPDSVINNDSTMTLEFYQARLDSFKQTTLTAFAAALEPVVPGYDSLKTALHSFLRKADLRPFSRIVTKDSTQIPRLVYKRIREEDTTNAEIDTDPDSLKIASVIKKYQKRKKLKADGIITPDLVKRLNNTDKEKFTRIAINLDRYKILNPLPARFIWVNIPSYSLQVHDSDTVVLKSKIVVGKPITKTPVLTSVITDMITYPKWNIPESIIKKDILPGLKRDRGYTLRKGFTLYDEDENEINPYAVNWAKYTNTIPYKVVQGSGDDNALGVMKFNFPNDFSVYLHDTNQRYLFSKTERALSHGCVRVQSWMELATYLLQKDTLLVKKPIAIDTVMAWLERKEKHVIPLRSRIPVFIRYFTCEGKGNRVVFYEDIYEDDRKLRDRYFFNK